METKLESTTRFISVTMELGLKLVDSLPRAQVSSPLRYPELAPSYVRNHGVRVLLQPAPFARDCSFRTWKSFGQTTAEETGCYFLAVNYARPHFGETSCEIIRGLMTITNQSS
jgi:hypothetical protein